MKGRYIVRRKNWRIYLFGSYSVIEINFGPIWGGNERVIHLFTKNGLLKTYVNEWPRSYLCH
jgi:hypothetical protein